VPFKKEVIRDTHTPNRAITRATTNTMARTPNRGISTYPDRKVPRMLPTEERA
jgi:hypothetical protein